MQWIYLMYFEILGLCSESFQMQSHYRTSPLIHWWPVCMRPSSRLSTMAMAHVRLQISSVLQPTEPLRQTLESALSAVNADILQGMAMENDDAVFYPISAPIDEDMVHAIHHEIRRRTPVDVRLPSLSCRKECLE